MSGLGRFSDPQALALQNYREFITLFNKIAESCFTSCVVDLSHRALSLDEESCVDRCSTKLININHRVMTVFMQIGPPVDKQLGLTGSGGGLM